MLTEETGSAVNPFFQQLGHEAVMQHVGCEVALQSRIMESHDERRYEEPRVRCRVPLLFGKPLREDTQQHKDNDNV